MPPRPPPLSAQAVTEFKETGGGLPLPFLAFPRQNLRASLQATITVNMYKTDVGLRSSPPTPASSTLP